LLQPVVNIEVPVLVCSTMVLVGMEPRTFSGAAPVSRGRSAAPLLLAAVVLFRLRQGSRPDTARGMDRQ
jgi:hypothetical protein